MVAQFPNQIYLNQRIVNNCHIIFFAENLLRGRKKLKPKANARIRNKIYQTFNFRLNN